MASEKGDKPKREDIQAKLWNKGVTTATYTASEKYQAAVLDQYKLYVEMADRISARRGLTNTFFVTLNSAVFTLIGVFWKDRPPEPSIPVLLVLLAVALAQAGAWFFIVRSYRQLNAAKYSVVGLLELKLPASPYDAEWTALKEGNDWRIYWPLTHVEKWVPILFGAIYIAGAVLVVAA
jgi:drug/metabolite transporter (DMT)-like permease